MPQSHIYTYLSTTTWTIILFTIFYIIMKQIFIPLIFENIKIKKLILNSHQSFSIINISKIKGYIYYNHKYNSIISKYI